MTQQNELFTVCKFLIDKFRENPIVNTISFEKTSNIDLNKENIFPLVNIDLINTDPIDNVLVFNFIINILQQRDYDNELNNDKLLDKTNLIDNLNECYGIATRLINNIRANFNDNFIEIRTLSPIQMVNNYNANSLDGVTFTLSLEIENTTPC